MFASTQPVPATFLGALALFMVSAPRPAAGAPGGADPAPAGAELAPAPALLPPSRVEVDPANFRMVLAGDIVVGVGGVGFVLMAAGLVLRSDALRQREAAERSIDPDEALIARQVGRAEVGTGLAIGGGVSAALCMGVGVTLIAVGRRRERLRRDGLRGRGAWLVPHPWLSPEGVGVGVALQF